MLRLKIDASSVGWGTGLTYNSHSELLLYQLLLPIVYFNRVALSVERISLSILKSYVNIIKSYLNLDNHKQSELELKSDSFELRHRRSDDKKRK
jgi:hypothetical protein